MIKGKLQIELKDEKTGRIERHEEENMVTNAVANLLGLATMAGYSTNQMRELIPISQKALGGIFLFDGTLDEDPDNIHFPMDVHLTGCAGRVANGTSKIIGSFNASESGRTDTGYTSVWDFSTSQANGTIAALSLTSYKSGEDPFHNSLYQDSGFSINLYYIGVGYDAKKGIHYLYYDGKIYEKRTYTNIITVNAPDFGEEKVVFDFGFTSPSSTYWTVVNGYDGYIYAIYCQSQSSKKSATVRIRRVKVSDFSFTEESELIFNVDDITCQSTYNYGYDISNIRYAVSKGFLYMISYDYKTVYKIDLSNTADVKSLTFDDARVTLIYPMYNGGVFARFEEDGLSSSGSKTTFYSPGWIYPDGKYRYMEACTIGMSDLSYYTNFEGDILNMAKTYRTSFYYSYSRLYLGTICNLSSPVVKTSAQSMKITYTLTDV